MILSISSSAAYSVECLGLKPYWLGKKDHIPQNTMITVCVYFSLILLRLLVEGKWVFK